MDILQQTLILAGTATLIGATVTAVLGYPALSGCLMVAGGYANLAGLTPDAPEPRPMATKRKMPTAKDWDL